MRKGPSLYLKPANYPNVSTHIFWLKMSNTDEARFEVHTAMSLTIQFFWDVKPYRWVKLHLLDPTKHRLSMYQNTRIFNNTGHRTSRHTTLRGQLQRIHKIFIREKNVYSAINTSFKIFVSQPSRCVTYEIKKLNTVNTPKEMYSLSIYRWSLKMAVNDCRNM